MLNFHLGLIPMPLNATPKETHFRLRFHSRGLESVSMSSVSEYSQRMELEHIVS